ncbi:hypothetical protein EV177_004055 [Coemansia sp. RSA 1804]|nr:hypothetical protein EV177_004055 [Coemansia sp. RSA 1804]
MPLVTFDIDSALSEGEHAAQTEPNTAASASPSKKWQEGRAERIRSLESTLSAVVRRNQHMQQHKSGRNQLPATRGADYYGSMLDGEGGGDGSTSDGQTSDDNWDSMSDSSSFFYNEGRAKTPEHVRKKLIRFRVYFVCCMEDEIRKVEIWTNMLSGSSWRGIELEELQEEQSDTTKNELIFLDQSQLPIGYRIKSFGLNTPSTAALTSRFEFTVRWRKNDQDDWRWISKVGQNARVVVFKDVPDLCHRPALNHWSQQLRLLLRKVKDPFSSDSDQPLTPVSDSWRASKTSASCIFKPQGKAEAGGTVFFGRLTDIERYLAFARKDKFWIIPKNGTDLSDLGDFEIVILVCELCNGTYAALMPFIKDDTRSMTITIKAEPRNMLHLLVLPQDVGAKTNGIRVAASASADMHSAVEEVFYRVHRSAFGTRYGDTGEG